MEIREMKYFCTIVEEGSILRASKKLLIAQPPLSRMIKNLEDELHQTLFIRGKSLTLTDAGKKLYDKCITILSLYDESMKELKNTPQTIKLGIVSSSYYALQNSLSNYYDKNIHFDIKEGNTYQLIDMMRHHLIDLAIVRTPFDQTDFETRFIKSEPMTVVSKNILNQNITLSDLNQKPLIVYRRFKSILESLFIKYRLQINEIAIVDDAKTAILLASKLNGYAIVPEGAFQMFNDTNLHQTKIIAKELETSLGITHLKNATLDPISIEFINEFINNN